MNKGLFISNEELKEMLEENFGVKADLNTIEDEEDGVELTKDVVEFFVDEEKVDEIINLLIDSLYVCESDILKEEVDDTFILKIDYCHLTPLINHKFNVSLTGKYQPTFCDLFPKPVLFFYMH